MKTAVAMSRSHGTRSENVEFEVLSSRILPMTEPARLAIVIHNRKLLSTLRMVSRYTQADANAPGRSTSDAVALACTGAIPANRRAGKVRKVPPPASALVAPPRMAAARRIRYVITGGRAPASAWLRRCPD